MSVAITIERVTKCYRQGPNSMVVLRDLTLAIQASQFISIMGPSGSGKSTLLNLIAGLDTPDAGRILIDEQDIAALTDDERSDFRLARVGFVFQSFNLLPNFTIEENLMWPLELLRRPRQEARMRARDALARVQLPEDVLKRRPRELSGGEQQRAAIARAIATEPKLLLADEPTGNLDSHTGTTVLELLLRLNRERGVTVVMVTHSPLAATHGDRTIEIQDGALVRDVRAPTHPARVIPIRT